MKKYILEDEWRIIEEGFIPELHESSESLLSLGNGHMGQRANFEEHYSGPSLQGHYIAGIYYPDKTKVGWWKNGYPEYFAKVLNAPSWIGINIQIDKQDLDLYKLQVRQFRHCLDMGKGILSRSFIAEFADGKMIQVNTKRFLSIVNREIGAIQYRIKALNFTGNVRAEFIIDADISNEDSNYNEKFWDQQSELADDKYSNVIVRTKKTNFVVSTGQYAHIDIDNQAQNIAPKAVVQAKFTKLIYSFDISEGQEAQMYKLGAVVTSRDYPAGDLEKRTRQLLEEAAKSGFSELEKEQVKAWAYKWEQSDIVIDGDISAQQGIRFNIFQLNQTYSGHDSRLNIGPKGFTGEKYGGSTYWDTEAYCLPFYLSTSDQDVPKNLLLYRYKQLDKAIENANKLGFSDGAALFPMVTMNGEESHNEWEITFEEIHRNGAIAYAIYNYIRHTGDSNYLFDYGLEVLIALSRFWAQRATFSNKRGKYVILGVTGPNEYENNVNNNWYTNYLAVWTLNYTLKGVNEFIERDKTAAKQLFEKLHFKAEDETKKWIDISRHMHMPEDQEMGIFLQQDGYLDKEQITKDQLSQEEQPINQHWSWDRILRSCFIKQADVLQGIYFFEENFTLDTLKKNFDFYEPRTLHESSLSPCIHVILASKLGLPDKAYELYLRTSRLDLDDYNNEVHEGCHITSMAGTWLAVVEGFGGMRVKDDHLHFDPLIPKTWKSLRFKVHFRGRLIDVNITHEKLQLTLLEGKAFKYFMGEKEYFVE
ncbi:MAG: glycoside hydrolase family 65 protein [Bacteroidales bacterium]|nr:glycoside hydrolase family 65 protein [Bacteroidales bacterium]